MGSGAFSGVKAIENVVSVPRNGEQVLGVHVIVLPSEAQRDLALRYAICTQDNQQGLPRWVRPNTSATNVWLSSHAAAPKSRASVNDFPIAKLRIFAGDFES
jgi:hypothetical protein